MTASRMIYRHPHVVRADEIDELGHASNVMYLRWVQEAAIAASADRGWDRQAYLSLGCVFVVRRHEIDYLLPAMQGDELELCTWVEAWSAATSLRKTRIVRKRDAREVGVASTTWALVAADTGRPTRIPAEMKQAFIDGGD
jgi:acyl-CoA thioester hydrolase